MLAYDKVRDMVRDKGRDMVRDKVSDMVRMRVIKIGTRARERFNMGLGFSVRK